MNHASLSCSLMDESGLNGRQETPEIPGRIVPTVKFGAREIMI